jgi:hypothetical protein
MVSLKRLARECLGLSGTISVNRDVYGYIFRDGSGRLFGQLSTASNPPEILADTFPGTGQPTARSLRQHLESVQAKAINLSMFMVGYNNFSGTATLDDLTKVQYAIQIARDIYAQADLGIRKIYWDRISVAAAGSFTMIAHRDEAKDLTDAFFGDNDGIDVFWVRTVDAGASPAGGFSDVEGPCDKKSRNEDDMTGVVIELNRERRRTGILLAHELGHYLGLEGGSSPTNLMGVASANQADDLTDGSTEITSSQAANMRDHECFVLPAC